MGTFRAKFEQYTVSGDPIPPDDGVCFWLDKRQVVDDCASTGGGVVVAFQLDEAPWLYVYRWNLSEGAFDMFEPPAYIPTGTPPEELYTPLGVRFSPNNRAVLVVLPFAPWVVAYRWSNIEGFGEAYPAPPTSLGPVTNPCWTDDGKSIVYMETYAFDGLLQTLACVRWDDELGFGIRLPNISVVGDVGRYAMNPANDVIVVSTNNSPYLSAVAFDSVTGFGSEYPPLTPAAPNPTNGLSFTPQGDVVLSTNGGGEKVLQTQWIDGTGFGAKIPALTAFESSEVFFDRYASVAILSRGTPVASGRPIQAMKWHPDLGIGNNGPTYSLPGLVPGASVNVRHIEFSPANDVVAIAYGGVIRNIFQWSADTGFGAAYPEPDELIGKTCSCIAFSHFV